MAHLKFRKYTHKHTGEPQYDPVDSDGIGGLFQKDIDEITKSGHTVEIIEDKPRMAASIFDQGEAGDDVMMEALDNIRTVFVGGPGSEERLFGPLMRGMRGETAFEKKLNSLNDRLQQFKANDEALIAAGVKPSSMPGGLKRLQTGTLQGGVPGPYIKGSPDNETRVLLDRDETGELIPIDTITFGQHKQLPGGHTKASEYLGEKILRLMGMEPELLNSKASHYADLIDKKSGKRIDVEIKDNDPGQHSGAVFALQVYTYLFPLDGKYREPYQIRADVERNVNNYASFNNVNMIDAVEALVQQGVLGPSESRFRIGKALKSDPRLASSEAARMDSIIMPGYTRETNQIGVTGGNEGSLVTAPTSIQEINLPLALEYVKQQKGDLEPRKKLRTRDSRGDEQMQEEDGHLRARLYMDIPNDATINGKQIADNVLDIHPLTQQLLARSELKKRYEK